MFQWHFRNAKISSSINRHIPSGPKIIKL